jgi:signal transduction histidine kinase
MIGTPITDWIVKTDRLRMENDIQTHFKATNERDAHYVLPRKDGSTFSGEFKTAIIHAAEGNAKVLIAVVRNITDRKQMEQRILRNTIETEERERERFSEDLHDGLGPLLSAVKIHLELIAARMGNPVEQGRFIKMTDDLLQESIKSTREIANNLTPNLLNDFGLLDALSVYVEKINKMNTIFIDFTVDQPFPALPKQTEVALYRVICELINNTLKHASANKISISLLKDEKQIEVRYSDNGIGFDVQKMFSSRSKGLGLSNIISRVKSINGNCTFESEPGRHFTSIISVGITDEPEKEILQNPEKI